MGENGIERKREADGDGGFGRVGKNTTIKNTIKPSGFIVRKEGIKAEDK